MLMIKRDLNQQDLKIVNLKLSSLNNVDSLEVVNRVSETQHFKWVKLQID